LLARTEAAKLASTINVLSLKRPEKFVVNCAVDYYGSDTVIAFNYPTDSTVDLWYKTSGCRTLDNGEVIAYVEANPTFGAFAGVVDSMTKPR
jgi:hypothetical protein